MGMPIVLGTVLLTLAILIILSLDVGLHWFLVLGRVVCAIDLGSCILTVCG